MSAHTALHFSPVDLPPLGKSSPAPSDSTPYTRTRRLGSSLPRSQRVLRLLSLYCWRSMADMASEHHLRAAILCPSTPINNDTARSRSRRLGVAFSGWCLWAVMVHGQNRSEERRVGKECRSRWSPYH